MRLLDSASNVETPVTCPGSVLRIPQSLGLEAEGVEVVEASEAGEVETSRAGEAGDVAVPSEAGAGEEEDSRRRNV